METQILRLHNVKDMEKAKNTMLEKVRIMVSMEATLSENMINVSKTTQWTKSKATITFTEKGKDLEILLATSHSATETAIAGGCFLALFGLVLVVVPWYLYNQDKKEFDQGLTNAFNYLASQYPE